jgi:hypothetical protein
MQGFGFVFTPDPQGNESNLDLALQFLAEDSSMASRIKMLVNGDDLVSDPQHLSKRMAFNISDLSLNEARQSYPSLLALAEVRVKPERDKLEGGPDAKRRKEQWWRWSRSTPALYAALNGSKVALAIAYTSPHMSFCVASTNAFYLNTAVIVTTASITDFSLLQSRVHETWSRFFASTLEDRLRYAPSDCFETFPFPFDYESHQALEAVGQAYHDYRAKFMVAENEGMTKTYNRFHKPDENQEAIQRLRELHDEMDRAVLRAYGWEDLAEELRPEFLSEETENDHTYQNRYFWPAEGRERVLARLLALNAERHAEEVAEGRVPLDRVQAGDTEDEDGELRLDLD